MVTMNVAKALTYGMLLGAGVMFLMDPRQGNARRALIRDKSLRAVHDLEDAAAIGARDMTHRAEGLAARLRRGGHRADTDAILVERVRSALGRVCSHPHAVRVTAKGEGRIELKGPILASDVEDVLSVVSRVRGVHDIDDDLIVFDRPHDVPDLQGEPVRRSRVTHMAPAAKLIAGGIAATVALASLGAGHPVGFLLGGVSVLGIARSIKAHGAPVLRLGAGRGARVQEEAPRLEAQSAPQSAPATGGTLGV